MIALNSPLKPDLKKLHNYLEKINKTGWYTNFGPLHNELTERLEDYLGVKNLLLVSNATLGLQVAGQALGSKSLLTTPFSFVATVSAFDWQNKKIAFSDINRSTYNLCPEQVQNALDNGSDADTILATHVYGNPCDVDAFTKLGQSNNVKILYDAAQAFGVKIKDESVLNFGDASVLSFHATKVFHTLEGGAIVFKNSDDFESAKNMINFGIKPGQGIVSTGINAKLNEYQAAVGLVNLEIIDDVIEHRAELFQEYRDELKDYVEIPEWHEFATLNGAYMPIKLQTKVLADKLKKLLAANTVHSRPYFYPSLDTKYKSYKSYGSENSHSICEGILCLPLHNYMTVKKIYTIVNLIKQSFA